jgi:hypothetical protein
LELSGEELWQAADRVRVFVAESPEALPEIRAALDPVEEQLWAEADAMVHDPVRWAGAGVSWGSAALHALRSCIPSSV